MNSAGLTRIAAPVGQALTQAGPPDWSLHMSHLTAFLGSVLSFAVEFLRPAPAPGRTAATSSNDGFSALALDRHLDHAIGTVLFAVAAADAVVGDVDLAVRACGGWRPADTPSCNAGVRNDGTRWARARWRRSGRPRGRASEVPLCVSAQAFSQLSQPTHSDSSISRTSVASPMPCATRNSIMLPALALTPRRRALADRRACALAFRSASRSGKQAKSSRNTTPGNSMVSVATAARTVAVRGESVSKASSPT
jgi:hypothetical protein